jgi:hypothetical protein
MISIDLIFGAPVTDPHGNRAGRIVDSDAPGFSRASIPDVSV